MCILTYYRQAKTQLIDTDIERSVARMQAVVELGRVVRDRRTMPVKYPLPEVVVIHKVTNHSKGGI